MDDMSYPTENINGAPSHDYFDLSVACVLCDRTLSPTESEDLLAISLCGDCKFLLLQEYETNRDDTHQRTPNRVRSEHASTESVENFLSFSQQFSQIMSPATQSQPVSRLRRTPSGSQRWRRVLSDTESDGFDSVYQESDSNLSISGHRPFQFESDVLSFSAYGGDSDASVDGRSVVDAEMFNPPSDLDSDIDIDPMRAGPNQWNSDDQEDEDGDESVEENNRSPMRAGPNQWNSDDQEDEDGDESVEENNRSLLTWRAQLRSPEFEGEVSVTIRQRRRRTQTLIVSTNSDEAYFVGLSGDYLDARGFNELLERLAEADNSRQGAPPAAVMFINTLPRLVINEGHLKHDSLSCAICKEALSLGGVVNQLPCLHLYHPPCILPWLRTRNSCPLCRYELPTDDKDYEERKRSATESNEEASSYSSDNNYDVEVDEFTNEYFARDEDITRGSGRGRWLFLAAAPIVSIVGIVMVMWLNGSHDLRRGSHFTRNASPSPTNQRGNGRRWWPLF